MKTHDATKKQLYNDLLRAKIRIAEADAALKNKQLTKPDITKIKSSFGKSLSDRYYKTIVKRKNGGRVVDEDAPLLILEGGGLTSKERGDDRHPYPSVNSSDFAGGNRSYPIPTKADAIDALRLAGLHGRSDVRSKVYARYPLLRKMEG